MDTQYPELNKYLLNERCRGRTQKQAQVWGAGVGDLPSWTLPGPPVLLQLQCQISYLSAAFALPASENIQPQCENRWIPIFAAQRR